MNYHNSFVLKTDSIVLDEFTPMEFRCDASQEKLKVGDSIVVIYLTEVVAGTCIPLEIPLIVKVDKFQGFIDRFIQIMDTHEKALATKASVVLPASETTDIAKLDTPTPEKPAEKTA